MSEQPVQEQNVTVYSDEASMANGRNGESTLQVMTRQVVYEPKVGLVLQKPTQLGAPLFGD